MSACVVDDDTIDFIVAAAAKYRATFYAPLPWEVDAETLAAAPADYRDAMGNRYQLCAISRPDLIGNVLYAQNVRSVNFRYKETRLTTGYTYRSVPFSEIDAVDVLKSIACLWYQSSETPGYNASFAAAILSELADLAIENLRGYEESPWGWTRGSGQAVRA